MAALKRVVFELGSKTPVSPAVLFNRPGGSSVIMRSMCTSPRLKEDVDTERNGEESHEKKPPNPTTEELVLIPRFLSKEQAMGVQKIFEKAMEPQWEMMVKRLNATKDLVRRDLKEMDAQILKLDLVGTYDKAAVCEELKNQVLKRKDPLVYTVGLSVGAVGTVVGAVGWYINHM